VQRRPEGLGREWEDVGFLAATAEEGDGAEYSFTDRGAGLLPAGTTVRYRLRQHDYNGTTALSSEVVVRLDAAGETAVLSAWPNPATATLSVQVRNAGSSSALLRITDLLGREVYRRRSTSDTPYHHWDLTDATGRRVPPGLYLVTLHGEGLRAVEKVVLQAGQ
jgi:hypothetical protein